MQCTASMSAALSGQALGAQRGAPRAQRSGAPSRAALQVRAAAATGFWDTQTATSNGVDSMGFPSRGSTWVEKPEAVKDYATLQAMLDEIQNNIALRQDTISLLTGEVQRLRTQMGGLEGSGLNLNGSSGSSAFSSAAATSYASSASAEKTAAMAASLLAQRAEGGPAPPGAPQLTAAGAKALLSSGLFSADKSTLGNLASYSAAVAAIIVFGGVVAPVLEDKMGLGGAAYYDFITSNGLPNTMAEVDPIVASHAGGAVGVLTAQLAQEAAAARRTGRVRQ